MIYSCFAQRQSVDFSSYKQSLQTYTCQHFSLLSIGYREKWLDPMSCCTLPIYVQVLAGFQNMFCGVKVGKPKDSVLP